MNIVGEQKSPWSINVNNYNLIKIRNTINFVSNFPANYIQNDSKMRKSQTQINGSMNHSLMERQMESHHLSNEKTRSYLNVLDTPIR